jgi:alpha-L-fucosidase
VPAEVDVSIRPGWYYHASEDHKVKTLPQLLDIYYNSIGRNGSFLLNIPVDRTGQIYPTDSARIMELAAQLEKDFEVNLAAGVSVEASSYRWNNPTYRPANVTDGDSETYWTTDDFTRSGSLTLDLGKKQVVNRFLVSEYIPLGQRVEVFHVEVLDEQGNWQQIASETTIGYKRILRVDDVTTNKVRFTVDSTLAAPLISAIELFRAPKLLSPPHISRDDQDMIIISAGDSDVDIYFTTDGSEPDKGGSLYKATFDLSKKAILRAVVQDPVSKEWSIVSTKALDIPRKGWKVQSGDRKMIDDNPASVTSFNQDELAVIDLGDSYKLNGFTYTPDQSRYATGIIQEYRFSISKNGEKWKEVAKGEFSNIKNNPIEQVIRFRPVKGRFIRLESLSTVDDAKGMKVAEIGVMTE